MLSYTRPRGPVVSSGKQAVFKSSEAFRALPGTASCSAIRMYRRDLRRRRAVLVTLIVASLVLLSLHFSESGSGPLHGAQRGVASLLAPLEDVASRALKPGRDAINWFDETFKAKGENDELKAEVASLREQLAEAQQAEGENDDLRKLLKLDRSPAAAEYDAVTARVLSLIHI